MKARRYLIGLLASAAALAFASGALAQDQQKMSPEEQEAMQKWMAFATPGAPHKALAESAGKWTFTNTMWMAPGAPPMESTGTSEREMVLGGRYLTESTHGDYMGQPFNGMSITGYDNLNQQYQNVWWDNMGTGFMISRGTVDAAGKVFSFTSESPDPISGKNRTYRVVDTWTDKDHHTFVMYDKGPDGKEFKMMEIAYTRAM